MKVTFALRTIVLARYLIDTIIYCVSLDTKILTQNALRICPKGGFESRFHAGFSHKSRLEVV